MVSHLTNYCKLFLSLYCQLFMRSKVWTMLFVVLLFNVVSPECNASKNRNAAQKKSLLNGSQNVFPPSILCSCIHKENVYFLLAKCFSNAPSFISMSILSYFAAHSVVIFLTKEEIVNCSPLGDLREIQLKIQVKETTPKIYNKSFKYRSEKEYFQ